MSPLRILGSKTSSSEKILLFVIFPQLVILVLVIAFLWFYYSTALVVGDSMLPTLIDEDRLLVALDYNGAVRGDVIVFTQATTEGQGNLVKRVIAIPGDEVEVNAGQAVVNGIPEDTHYDIFTSPADVSTASYRVPEGYVFVLGDNRPGSADSRFFGPIPLSDVKGRAVWIIWPLDRAGFVDDVRNSD